MYDSDSDLDDDDQRRLEQAGIGGWIQDRRRRLKRLEQAGDVARECKIVPEKHLQVASISRCSLKVIV